MNSELHKYLRIGVMVAWVVLWNVLLGVSIWLNDGLGHVRVPLANWPTAVALLGSSAFALLIAHSERVQAWALRPGTSARPIRKELWFVALLTGALGSGALYGALVGALGA